MYRILRLPLIALSLSLAAAASWASDDVVRGLDHIPLAVKDLDQSRADFEALGFVLKPGRAHRNGLRNAHAKFPDGTEIELITASSASDALSSDYLAWLKYGEGPALLGLFAPNFEALNERLSPSGLALDENDYIWTFANAPVLKRVFFSHRQHSPTDEARHFAHPNTAFSLSGVWLAGAEAERRLMTILEGAPTEMSTCGPFGSAAAAVSLPEAKIVFVPASAQIVPGRPIVAVTVLVRSLQAVQDVLTGHRIAFELAKGCDKPSLWVGPRAAHGMWLEFRQAAGS